MPLNSFSVSAAHLRLQPFLVRRREQYSHERLRRSEILSRFEYERSIDGNRSEQSDVDRRRPQIQYRSKPGLLGQGVFEETQSSAVLSPDHSSIRCAVGRIGGNLASTGETESASSF